jgi:hypothetical protein
LARRTVLVAEFFDMDAFFTAERKKARGMPDYDEQMQAALDRARQIKSKRRRPRSPALGEKNGSDEKV